MGRFINDTGINTNVIINNWEQSSFLDGIESEDTKELISMAYEFAAQHMLTYIINYERVEVLIFPAIRRIFIHDNRNFDSQTLLHLIVRLIDDLYREYNKEQPHEEPSHGIDYEAEFLARFCSKYVENKFFPKI